MASVTTINTSPVPVTALSQNVLSVANSQVSGTLTIPVVNSPVTVMPTVSAAPITVNNSNSVENSSYSQVLNKQRLKELVREVDPNVQPDEDVEELLLQIAEDFIEDVADTSCRLAKHRKSDVIEVKDVQLSLEKNWNMWIPGFGGDEIRPYKKSATTDAHRQRMNLIKRAK